MEKIFKFLLPLSNSWLSAMEEIYQKTRSEHLSKETKADIRRAALTAGGWGASVGLLSAATKSLLESKCVLSMKIS